MCMKKVLAILLCVLLTLPMLTAGITALAADAMSGFTEQTNADTAFMDFSDLTYGKLDKFVFGDQAETGGVTTYSGRRTAAFTSYLYVAVKDSYIGSSDADVTIRLTYLDTTANTSIKLQYNSNNPDAYPNQNYTDRLIPLSGSGSWTTTEIRLTDASFRNAQNGQCDLRFSGAGLSTVYISRIELIKNTGAGSAIVFDNPVVETGIHRIANSGDCATTLTTAGGQSVLRLDQYGYFSVSDNAVKSASQLTMQVTYYDSTTANLTLQYCSSYLNSDGTQNKFYNITVPRYGTNTFVTTTIPLSGVDFSVTHNYGGHFRFSGGGYLRSISLTVGVQDDTTQAPPAFAAQTAQNNLIGKGVAGYQAWFRAGNTESEWGHWGGNGHANPQKDALSFEIWPQVSDYAAAGATLYQSGFENLGNGENAKLFNSLDPAVIDTHFSWMQQYGIDGAAVQRFVASASPIKTTAANHLQTIRDKAEKYGRLFYVMYDLSGGASMGTGLLNHIKLDFIYNVEDKGVASSSAYAHADNKPVVCLWGLAGDDATRYPNAAVALELVNWFKARGYYVIGGLPDNQWYNRTDSYANVYKALDMASPWTVGRYDINSVSSWLSSQLTKELAYCQANGLDYQPVIFPGFAWTNMGNNGTVNNFPRAGGQFIWKQAYQLKQAGLNTMYFAMFDEYDEGTAFMKGSSDYFDIPTDQYFLTYAADGLWLSDDFYLRAAGAAMDMVKGTTPLRDTIDIPHSLGPVYWRNSFESRATTYVQNGITYNTVANIDVCLHNPALLTAKSSGAALTANAIVSNAGAKSGSSAFRLAGTSVAGTSRTVYKVADTVINAGESLKLTYSLKAENTLGRYVFVDLLFSDGTMLSDYNSETRIARGTIGSWTDVSVRINDVLNGKTITGIVVGYDHGEAGNFSALVDDIAVTSTTDPDVSVTPPQATEAATAFVDYNAASYSKLDRFVFGDDPTSGMITVHAGRRTARIGGYLYLAVNDTYIGANDNDVIVRITYLDDTAGASMKLQYNSNNPDNYSSQNYTDYMVTLAGTGNWVTKEIVLTDASFRNAQNGQCDLRIGLHGGADALYISRVELVNPGKPVAEIIFGSTEVGNGITLIPSSASDTSDCKHELVTYNGTEVRHINAYLYCTITDERVKAASKVKVAVQYFDVGTGNLAFQYNSTSSNYQTAYISKSGTGNLVTTELTLDDVSFGGKQNYGGDFRISGGDGYIKSIAITILS